jgi:hypothetical protein
LKPSNKFHSLYFRFHSFSWHGTDPSNKTQLIPNAHKIHSLYFRFHSFSWHGTDPSNKTQLIPDAHKFQKLQIIPGQFYYNVISLFKDENSSIIFGGLIFRNN